MLTMNFNDKIVCVTGAGGSIGSEICRQLVDGGVKELRLVSLTENGLYNITKELARQPGSTKVVGILGSVTNSLLMQEAVYDCDIVIHAAAHKHVNICEQNPLAAIENNVLGTATIAAAAREANVKQFILVSTDKAVRPTSVMGATKRWAELILRDLVWKRFAGKPLMHNNQTCFRIVRFGNVLGSAGSVLPLWRDQIRAGGPVTLTDARCTRYFMEIEDAARLALSVLDFPPALGPYVFDMGQPVNMMQLAMNLIVKYSSLKSVDIVETGLRPGEKLEEELYYDGSIMPTADPKINYLVENILYRLEAGELRALADAVMDADHSTALEILWSVLK
jgi:FlaA1/EpsC-like NDP-sugar epimerase